MKNYTTCIENTSDGLGLQCFIYIKDGGHTRVCITARVEDGLGHVGELMSFNPRENEGSFQYAVSMRKVLRICIAWLRDNGAIGIVARVDGDNRRRYKSLGFRPVFGCPMLISSDVVTVLARLGVKGLVDMPHRFESMDYTPSLGGCSGDLLREVPKTLWAH